MGAFIGVLLLCKLWLQDSSYKYVLAILNLLFLAFLRVDYLFVLLCLSVFIGTKTQAENLGNHRIIVTDVVGEIRNTDCVLPFQDQ